MFEDFVVDLFGLDFEEWMDKNQVVSAGFIHWSELEVLPDDHPEHKASLEENMEDGEVAIHLIANSGNITIVLSSGTIVEKSNDFPDDLLSDLKSMAENGPSKVQLKEL